MLLCLGYRLVRQNNLQQDISVDISIRADEQGGPASHDYTEQSEARLMTSSPVVTQIIMVSY